MYHDDCVHSATLTQIWLIYSQDKASNVRVHRPMINYKSIYLICFLLFHENVLMKHPIWWLGTDLLRVLKSLFLIHFYNTTFSISITVYRSVYNIAQEFWNHFLIHVYNTTFSISITVYRSVYNIAQEFWNHSFLFTFIIRHSVFL